MDDGPSSKCVSTGTVPHAMLGNQLRTSCDSSSRTIRSNCDDENSNVYGNTFSLEMQSDKLNRTDKTGAEDGKDASNARCNQAPL